MWKKKRKGEREDNEERKRENQHSDSDNRNNCDSNHRDLCTFERFKWCFIDHSDRSDMPIGWCCHAYS